MPVPTVVQFSTRKDGVLPLWDRCVELPNIYTCPVERFLQVLSAQYAAPVNERNPGLADAGEPVGFGEGASSTRCLRHSLTPSLPRSVCEAGGGCAEPAAAPAARRHPRRAGHHLPVLEPL